MTTGLKIIFAGTPEFAAKALQALLSSHHQIIAVYTQPDRPAGRGQKLRMSPVKELALQANIPVFQPTTLEKEECMRMAELKADLMLVTAYGLLLSTDALNTPKLGCINIHASLLPRWRGAAPMQRAIIAGDTQTGISIMQIVERLDAGPILYQIKCEISANDTTDSLHDRLAKMAAQEIVGVLQRLQNHELIPIPQEEHLASYANKLSKQEASIDWQESAKQIERKIRAFNSWPVAYTYLDASRVRIWEAVVHNTQSQQNPGSVVEISNKGIEVATGKEVLIIKKLQLSGGKAISAKDFINAHNIAHQRFRCNGNAMAS